MRTRGIHTVYELPNLNVGNLATGYTMEPELLQIAGTDEHPFELFWTSDSLDWVIYLCHENAITVGGWLLSHIQQSWPGYRKHPWSL